MYMASSLVTKSIWDKYLRSRNCLSRVYLCQHNTTLHMNRHLIHDTWSFYSLILWKAFLIKNIAFDLTWLSHPSNTKYILSLHWSDWILKVFLHNFTFNTIISFHFCHTAFPIIYFNGIQLYNICQTSPYLYA